MRQSLLGLVLSLALVSNATSQSGVPVGYQDFGFVNTTGQGSSTLRSRVFYPATTSGPNAPLQPQAGGYPVIVFLHGFTALGSWYSTLANQLASQGYVAVMSDTAQFSSTTQVFDGLALYPALVAANTQPGGFLNGALDMQRAGLCGHSMGGGSTVRVLAANPGYLAGLGFAPVTAGTATASVRVPLCFIHGQGDTIVPPNNGSIPLYSAATAYTGVKVLYLLDASANHNNVAGFLLSTPTDQQVFARCAAVTLGFFDRYLRGNAAGLEATVGPAARAEPRLAQLSVEVEAPELWSVGSSSLGQVLRWTVLAQPGPAALFAAAGPGAVTTPFGVLALDPATLAVVLAGAAGSDGLLAVSLTIPQDPVLVGASVPFQGIGGQASGALRLTPAQTLTVLP